MTKKDDNVVPFGKREIKDFKMDDPLPPEARPGRPIQAVLWSGAIDLMREAIMDIKRSGKEPDGCIVLIRNTDGENESTPIYCMGLNRLEAIGLLQNAINDMN